MVVCRQNFFGQKRFKSVLTLGSLCAALGASVTAHAQDMATFPDFEAQEKAEIQVPPPAEAETTTTTTTNEDGTTTTAKTAPVGKLQTRTKWDSLKYKVNAGFFTWTSAAADTTNRGRPSVESYNYVSLNYSLGRGEKIFYRPAFLYKYGGNNALDVRSEGNFEWADGYFGYANYNLPWLPFNMDYKSEIRWYIPTGEGSRNTGMLSRFRGDFQAWHVFTPKTSMLIWFKPDYFIQSRRAYRHTSGYARSNKHYGYEFLTNVEHKMSRMFSVGTGASYAQNWAYESEVENLTEYVTTYAGWEAFVGVTYKALFAHIGITQERNVRNPRDEFAFLKDTETQYFLRSYYRF